jgi:outer membrane receptor protein involved in Fe transport
MIAALLFLFVPVLAQAPVGQSAAAPARAAQTGSSTAGVVRDSDGGTISGAVVVARTPAGNEQRTVTGPDGRFSIALPPPFDLTVLAGGFAESKRTVAVGGRDPIEVVLTPAVLKEQVTVTAARGEQRLADTPASVSVLTKEDIRQSPGVVSDEVLKQLPQFALFRRSSSLSAHPTSQGVSLRGIGPSGVSRTLVLLDGVPYNDPFGGWVYWTGIPLDAADRLEVVDNSSSSLYGNYAMGGVINIVTAKPTRRTVEFKTLYGSRNTPKAEFRASDVWGKLGVTVDGAAFDTDGYPNVAPSERRTTDQTPPGVDNNVSSKFHDFNVKAEYAASDRVQIFGRVGYFKENRNNGKAATYTPTGAYVGGQTEEANDTLWKTTNVGTRVILPDQSTLQATLFTDNETFDSNFLAVPVPPGGAPLRSAGKVSLNQTVPTKGVGGMAQWSKAFMGNQMLSAGFDFRWVEGESQEQAFNSALIAPFTTALNPMTPTVTRLSGGSQTMEGAFVQDIITPTSKWQLTLSARTDHWRSYNAHNLETTTATGARTANYRASCSVESTNCLADRTDTVVSPRAAALYHVTDMVSVWGDYGLGFRAPTLNELYRQFSVGAVVTKANADLGPEHLKGGEFGVNVQPAKNLTARATWFDNRVKDPVANVTIATNTQQRLNLGRTRITGLQLDTEYRLGASWRFNAAYLYEQAKVVEANIAFAGALPAGTNLGTNCPGPNLTNPTAATGGSGTGQPCYLAQVPKNRVSFRAAYSNPKYATVALSVTMIGQQYDDDQNFRVIPAQALSDAGYPTWTAPLTDSSTFVGLPKYTVVDLFASHTISRNLEAFFGVENLADRQYFVGTAPTLLGPPRLVTGGVRVKWQGK